MAKLLVGLAGPLSCCDMLRIMSPWKMAAVKRSGSWPPFSPASSTTASTLVHCRPASPQRSSFRMHKPAPLKPPTTGTIAVGEPLYLAVHYHSQPRKLVGWSEEHQLRSPVQAGFRPGQSPIHHLFALRHFSRYSSHFHTAPCMPAL